MKNAISEINNTMEGINSKLDEAVDHISDGRQGREKNTRAEQQEEKQIFYMRGA